jgi:hypothetical protein
LGQSIVAGLFGFLVVLLALEFRHLLFLVPAAFSLFLVIVVRRGSFIFVVAALPLQLVQARTAEMVEPV